MEDLTDEREVKQDVKQNWKKHNHMHMWFLLWKKKKNRELKEAFYSLQHIQILHKTYQLQEKVKTSA